MYLVSWKTYQMDHKTFTVLPGVDAELVKITGTADKEITCHPGDTTSDDVNTLVKDYDKTYQKYAKKTAVLDFSSCHFTEPGVYRYIITESGVNQAVENDSLSERIVDVYIENAEDSHTDGNVTTEGLKFAGYVLHSSEDELPEDVDEVTLSYAEIKALATGNPYIKEKMQLDVDVAKLKLMKANYTSQIYRMEDDVTQRYPKQITEMKEFIRAYGEDVRTFEEEKRKLGDNFSINISNQIFTERKEAGEALLALCSKCSDKPDFVKAGNYLGFSIMLRFDPLEKHFYVSLRGAAGHATELGADPSGNITRMGHVLESMKDRLRRVQDELANVERQLETTKQELKKPFAREEELNQKLDRLSVLNALLDMDVHPEKEAGMQEKPQMEEQKTYIRTVPKLQHKIPHL